MDIMFRFKIFVNKFIIGILLFASLLACKKKEEAAPLPITKFYLEYSTFVNDTCSLYMYDNSYSAVKWEWQINNSVVSENKSDSSIIVDGNLYKVELTIQNSDGVLDSKVKIVDFTN